MTLMFIIHLVSGQSFPQSMIHAIIFGIAVFLMWALGREIDPEYDYSAFLGILFLFFQTRWIEQFNVIFIFWILLSLRIINRTTGKPAGILDQMGLLVITSILGLLFFPIISLLTSIVFSIDAVFGNLRKRGLLLAFFSLLVFPFAWFFGNNPFLDYIPLSVDYLFISIVTLVLMTVIILDSKRITTLDDTGEKPIPAQRVQAGQILAFITVIVFLVLYGETGFLITYLLLFSFIGIILYRIGFKIGKHKPFVRNE